MERRIHEHDGSEKKQDKIEFGAKFLSCINDFIEKKGKTEATLNQVNGIKSRCKSVLVEALDQVNQRLPPVANVFAELSNLNPSSVISQTNRPEFKNLPFPHLYEDKINQVDEQYRRLICMDVNAECFEGKGIPGDTELFWSALIKHESLKDLAEYALTCLTMPVSNASVERMFSILTAVKTKPRNRLHVQTLECIVRVRAELLLKKKCCTQFEVTSDMLSLFNFKDMYPRIASAASTSKKSETATPASPTDVNVTDMPALDVLDFCSIDEN